MFCLVHSSGHSAKVPALITNLKLATTQAQLPVLALEGVEFNGRGMSCCFFFVGWINGSKHKGPEW